VSARPATDTDAAMVLGMASTAMPFARSSEEQAERWLRLLRAHGQAGLTLHALGVSEAPLSEKDAPASAQGASSEQDPRGDVVRAVTERAIALAERRGEQVVGTGDVLMAVIEVYGEDFDRVLRGHGTDSQEVRGRLVELLGERRD
jgi:hypothetical protein